MYLNTHQMFCSYLKNTVSQTSQLDISKRLQHILNKPTVYEKIQG